MTHTKQSPEYPGRFIPVLIQYRRYRIIRELTQSRFTFAARTVCYDEITTHHSWWYFKDWLVLETAIG